MSVQLSEGQTFGPRAINVTRTTLVRYAGASGDFNPIHYSDRAAREAGMDGVIAHGMWTMGAALGTVIEWVGGPERVVSQRARFTRPVQVPDTEGAPLSRSPPRCARSARRRRPWLSTSNAMANRSWAGSRWS